MADRATKQPPAMPIATLERHPLLRRWIQPQHLDVARLRESARAKPSLCYLVLDDFFNPEMLARVVEEHDAHPFQIDDPESNYHSTAVRADRDHLGSFGAQLFLHPAWHRYLAAAVGARLRRPGRTVVKYRRHPGDARGFWIHTDRDQEMPKALVALGYFNHRWTLRDGGVLQFWRAYALREEPRRYPRWSDYLGRRLTFLERKQRFPVEIETERGPACAVVDLVDQILPTYNRVVICNFQRDPSYHSVTPSRGRRRDGFMQWLY